MRVPVPKTVSCNLQAILRRLGQVITSFKHFHSTFVRTIPKVPTCLMSMGISPWVTELEKTSSVRPAILHPGADGSGIGGPENCEPSVQPLGDLATGNAGGGLTGRGPARMAHSIEWLGFGLAKASRLSPASSAGGRCSRGDVCDSECESNHSTTSDLPRLAFLPNGEANLLAHVRFSRSGR